MKTESYTDFVAHRRLQSRPCAPKIVQALTEQARTLWHVSNLFYTVPQKDLGLAHSPQLRRPGIFLQQRCRSERGAIKLPQYFNEPGRASVPDDQHGAVFHGRTMATLSATGQEKVRHGSIRCSRA